MNAYEQEINLVTSRKILEPRDIFIYSESPYSQDFDAFFNFVRENININSEEFCLQPRPTFIYRNDTYINSSATKFFGEESPYYHISYNSGNIIYLLDLFNNENFNNFFETQFPLFYSKLDNFPSRLGYQFVSQFIYYHELAHLIQFREIKDSIESNEINTTEYSLTKHKLELNADNFALLYLTQNVIDYLERIFYPILKSEVLLTFSTGLLCFLNYLLNTNKMSKDFYTNSNSHPHIFIRLFNCLIQISFLLTNSNFLVRHSINISQFELFELIINLYEDLEKDKIFDTTFSNIITQFEPNKDQITGYISLLLNFDEVSGNYIDSLTEWNKIVSKSNN